VEPGKTYSIPFEQLIQVLKTNGYEISVADVLNIEKILLAQNILELCDNGEKHLKLTVDKLPFLITPIIAKNKKEQSELTQLIQGFIEEQRAIRTVSIPYHNQPSPLVTAKKRSGARLIGWLTACAILIAAAIYFIYQYNKPEHIPVVLSHSPSPSAIGDSVKFAAFVPLNIVTNNSAEWIIDDSTYQTKYDTIMHVFKKEALNLPVTFNVRTADSFMIASDSIHIDVACSKLNIQPHYKNIDPGTNLPEIGSVASFQPVFSNKDLYNNDSLSYLWYVNGSLIGLADTFNFNFLEAKDYSIRLVTLTNGTCLSDSLTAELLIPLKKKSPVKLYVTGAFDIDQVAFIKPWWKTSSLIVCTCILLLFQYFAFFRRRKRKKQAIDLSWSQNKNEPFHLHLRNKNDLIGNGPNINRIANIIRSSQKIADPILNIAGTIKKTSEYAGFPSLQFKSSIKRNELIILASKTQTKNNHLAELFQWFIHRLQSDDVYIEKYYYSASPEHLFDDSGNSTTLKDLSTLKTDHILVIFDDCRNFLSTKASTIQNDVVKTLSEWSSKAIITPIPLLDWGVVEYQFRLNNFLVAPAELEAIEVLSKALVSDTPLDKPTIYPFLDDPYAVSAFDFQSIDNLKEYLESEVLFQWVCALAVYPRLDWAITLSLGNAIADAMHKPGDVNKTVIDYNTLLKISRINWLQKDRLPNPIRIELLKNLNKDIHLLAREQLIILLEEVKDSLPPGSFAKIEWETQYNTNAFFLYKHYPGKYKRLKEAHDAMEMLWPLLSDWPLNKITADRQNNLLENKSNPAKNLNFNEYFSQHYRKIRKRNIIGTVVLSVLMLLLYIAVTDLKYSSWIPFIPKGYSLDLRLDGDTCFRENHNSYISYRPEGSFTNIPIDTTNNHYRLILNDNELRGVVTVRGSDYTKDTIITFNSASSYFFFATCRQKNSNPLKPIDTLKKSLRSLIGTLPPVYITYFEQRIEKIHSSGAFYKIELPAYLNNSKKDSIALLANQLLVSEQIKNQPIDVSEEAPIFDSLYYNERGKLIYKTSYNKPEKSFVIRTSKGINEIFTELPSNDSEPVAPVVSISKAKARRIESLIRRGAVSDPLVSDNVVPLLNRETLIKMYQSIMARRGSGNENTVSENGGFVDQYGNVFEADSTRPRINNHSTNGLVYYHSHPDGIKTEQGRPYIYIQGPSKQDIETTSSAATGYVFGMSSKLVYVYNSNGVIATLPFSFWRKTFLSQE